MTTCSIVPPERLSGTLLFRVDIDHDRVVLIDDPAKARALAKRFAQAAADLEAAIDAQARLHARLHQEDGNAPA